MAFNLVADGEYVEVAKVRPLFGAGVNADAEAMDATTIQKVVFIVVYMMREWLCWYELIIYELMRSMWLIDNITDYCSMRQISSFFCKESME